MIGKTEINYGGWSQERLNMMELINCNRQEMIEKAKSLVGCLEQEADEDAYYHCLDLLHSIHRDSAKVLADMKCTLDQLKGHIQRQVSENASAKVTK